MPDLLTALHMTDEKEIYKCMLWPWVVWNAHIWAVMEIFARTNILTIVEFLSYIKYAHFVVKMMMKVSHKHKSISQPSFLDV